MVVKDLMELLSGFEINEEVQVFVDGKYVSVVGAEDIAGDSGGVELQLEGHDDEDDANG